MPGAIPRSDSLPRWPEWTWPPMTARAQSSAPRSRDSRPIDGSRQRLEERVADWIASDVQPYPSDPNSTGEPQGRLDPDAHAHAVIRALESRCEALGVYPALLPAAALQVCRHCRRSGRGATKGWPPGRCPPDRRMSLRLREDAGTKRSQRSGVPPGAVRSLRAGIEKRLESRGFPTIEDGDCERRWAKLVPRYVSTPGTRPRESRSPVSRTSWSVWPPSDLIAVSSRRSQPSLSFLSLIVSILLGCLRLFDAVFDFALNLPYDFSVPGLLLERPGGVVFGQLDTALLTEEPQKAKGLSGFLLGQHVDLQVEVITASLSFAC